MRTAPLYIYLKASNAMELLLNFASSQSYDPMRWWSLSCNNFNLNPGACYLKNVYCETRIMHEVSFINLGRPGYLNWLCLFADTVQKYTLVKKVIQFGLAVVTDAAQKIRFINGSRGA